MSFWLNGESSGNCCVFAEGSFVESRFFGEGIGVAVKRGNDTLRRAINYALFRIWETGRFTDLWLK
jgi:polar amino acid transport system substrate-binding protein